MSFEVDIVVRRGGRPIACAFAGGAGVTALLGPSGAGKTSVLDAIAGLVRPDYGFIRVSGRTLFEDDPMVDDIWDYTDLPPEDRWAGYVFQDARLFPHMTVRDNLLYGTSSRSFRAQSRNASAAQRFSTSLETNGESGERLAFLGIAHLLDRWPRSLSGGEARRVAIGRALLSEPAFLLLDEPLSSLDRARREEVMAALEQLRDRAELPMLLVTHDRSEAERLGAEIVEID